MEYALSNAHSTILSRHIQQAEYSLKEAHENERLKKSKFGPDEIQKKFEIQILGDFVFGLSAIMSATVSSMNPRKKFHRLIHICFI